MIIDLNGKHTESRDALIDVADRGFTLGDGIFETIRVRDGKPDRFTAHMTRMRYGAKILGIPMPTTSLDVEIRLTKIVEANNLRNAVVRLTLSHGPAPRGLLPPDVAAPTFVITASPLPKTASSVKAILAIKVRRNEFSASSRIKSLSYVDNVIARREAAEYGADDALILNTQGRLAESTVSNLFLMINGTLLTPPVSDGALAGVMRADLISHFRAEEQPLEVDDLAKAEEAFLTNALGVRALIAVADQPIGDGEPGPTTRILATKL